MKRSILYLAVSFFSLGLTWTGNTPAAWSHPGSAQNETATKPNGQKLTPRQEAEMRADLLSARKEYESAAQAYEDLAKSDPHNAQLLNKIGVVYEASGNYPLH